MPCPHKFQKYLNLERLREGFEPTTLIVGTFTPAWPEGNPAQWFYGRTRNNYFWDVLPMLYLPEHNLRKASAGEWKAFCAHNKIALTDIVSIIKDAEQDNEEHQNIFRTYLDTSIADYFADFEFTDIKELLLQKPTIRNVYLTRLKGIPIFDEQWEIVEQYGYENGLHIRNLITPSASARFQIRDYKQAYPKDPTPLKSFIHYSWKQQWHI